MLPMHSRLRRRPLQMAELLTHKTWYVVFLWSMLNTQCAYLRSIGMPIHSKENDMESSDSAGGKSRQLQVRSRTSVLFPNVPLMSLCFAANIHAVNAAMYVLLVTLFKHLVHPLNIRSIGRSSEDVACVAARCCSFQGIHCP